VRRAFLIAFAVLAATSATARAEPTVGVSSGAGVPDGASASLALRSHALRLEVGAAFNGVGPGGRIGLTYVPLKRWFSPVIGLGGGRFVERDANPFVRMVIGDPTFSSATLDKVGYDYATARAGFEFGHDRFTFYLHAGVTRVVGTAHDIGGSSMDPNVTLQPADAHVRLTTVSADVGIILYLF
jgi:hypothetical protein